MAKGNMLLGMSRGSVGDVTFYRSGGSQRARARNRKPANPMTVRQQTQRSKFANAVKFYKQVTSNFFRFAYEDKKVNESDYNAFMRHNVGNSGYIGAQASKIATWPALGQWEITNGSLPSIDVGFYDEEPTNGFIGYLPGLGTSITTIGALSSAVIGASDVYREGDILTILLYGFTPKTDMPSIDVTTSRSVDVKVLQFTLNTSDNTLLSTITANVLGVNYSLSVKVDGNSNYGLVVGTESNQADNIFVQSGYVHSRNTDKGLLVSTSVMITNISGTTIINNALSDSGAYYNSIIADWNASSESVLQGAVSAN